MLLSDPNTGIMTPTPTMTTALTTTALMTIAVKAALVTVTIRYDSDSVNTEGSQADIIDDMSNDRVYDEGKALRQRSPLRCASCHDLLSTHACIPGQRGTWEQPRHMYGSLGNARQGQNHIWD